MKHKIIFTILSLALLNACGAENRRPMTDKEYADAEEKLAKVERLTEYGSLFCCGASSPHGKFILIRDVSGLCAIRFVEFHHSWEEKSPTVGPNLLVNKYAQYEWYFIPVEINGDFENKLALHGSGAVKSEPLSTTFGGIAFTNSDTTITCGKIRLDWLYPNNVMIRDAGRWNTLSNERKNEVLNYEISPTNWSEIKEIDLNNPALKWFRLDPNAGSTKISGDALPGAP